jgi:Niemann-Pick C1 protein
VTERSIHPNDPSVVMSAAPIAQRVTREDSDAPAAVAVIHDVATTRGKATPVEGGKRGLADRVNDFIGVRFDSLGRMSAAKPWRVIGASALFCLACAAGLGAPGLTNENRGDKLWVPDGTPAQADKALVDEHYGKETRFAQLILKSTTVGANVLTPEGLAALENVASQVRATSIEWEGSTYAFTDHCYKTGATCYEKSVLDAFASPWSTPTQATIDSTLGQTTITDPSDSSTVLLESVAGGLTYSGTTPSATAISVTFLFKNNEEIKNGEPKDDKGDEFDSKVLKIFETPPTGFEVSYVTERSFGDEFGSTINGDLTKLQAALVLILAYAALTLSKWRMGCVGSRVGVTFAGIISIGMSIASSYGLGAYFGIFFSPLMNVLPFLLLGIGVDDMFVIVNAYDNCDRARDPVDRMGRSLRISGMSITVTSLTDVIAFLIGSTTSLPALRNFCYYAALGIFFDYFYQVTFFTACLALDEQRKAKNQGDIFCCLTCSPQACCSCCNTKDEKSIMQRVLGKGLGGQITKKKVKYGVLSFFTALTVGGIIGATKMQVDADVNDFIPDGSYLKDYFSDLRTYFARYGDPVEIYTTSSINLLADDSVLRAATAAFKQNEYVVEASVSSWVDDFYTYRTANSQALNSANLRTWLAGAGSRFKNDVVFNDDNTAIVSSRVHGNHVKVDKSKDNVKSMDSLRADLAAVTGNEDGDIFAYGRDWLNYEQYKSIANEAVRNVTVTLAACLVIIAILVVEIKTVISVFLALCMIFVNIVGYMHFWGLSIDSVTVIMLVIALGLAVDYSAHIGRAYLEKLGTPDERVIRTLEDMGVAVWNGAMSTFMAVLILGSSDSYVFQTFFKQLFLCIVLGLTHGLIFLPTLLSLLNPKPYAEAH